MRHRTGLIMLAATFFPVLEMISDIQPFQTGVEQIDDAMRRISNAVRPVMRAISEINEKHIAILDEIEEMKTNENERFADGLKNAMNQITEMNTYIDLLTIGDLEEGLQDGELEEHNRLMQDELKRLASGLTQTLKNLLSVEDPSQIENPSQPSDDEVTI